MTKKEVFATHCGLDFSEVKDYLYRYGKTSIPVWAIDNVFYCVTKGNEKTATDNDMNWEWYEIKDDLANSHGYKIWATNDY